MEIVMKKSTLTASAVLAAAAFSGLLTGTANAAMSTGSHVSAARSGTVSTATSLAGTRATNMDDAPATAPAKHDCKGKNDCKGAGGCKTGDMGCKAKNTCKGKGGCSTMAGG
jgi:hypothetical protein